MKFAIDCHVHLRRGEEMRRVLPATTGPFRRAIVMPPNRPPLIDIPVAMAEYAADVADACSSCPEFTPHLACDVSSLTTPDLVPHLLEAGAEFAKVYLTRTTDPTSLLPTLRAFVDHGVKVLVHGSDCGLGHLSVIDGWLRSLPVDSIVLEHLHRAEEVEFCRVRDLHATITAHHMVLTAETHPHFNCVPRLGSRADAAALRNAARDGGPLFMFGSDSAPHPEGSDAPGVFAAPFALGWVSRIVFDEALPWFTGGAARSFHGWAE